MWFYMDTMKVKERKSCGGKNDYLHSSARENEKNSTPVNGLCKLDIPPLSFAHREQ